jgi:hypothetical protein
MELLCGVSYKSELWVVASLWIQLNSNKGVSEWCPSPCQSSDPCWRNDNLSGMQKLGNEMTYPQYQSEKMIFGNLFF